MTAQDEVALLQPLSEAYGFSDIAWRGPLGGLSSHNQAFVADGAEYVLKRYGPAAQVQVARLEQLALYLSSQAFSAPVPLLARNGQRHIAVNGAVYAVSPRFPGEVLHQDSLSATGLEAAATLLSRLHGLGSGAPVCLGVRRSTLTPAAAQLAHSTLRERMASRDLRCEHRDLIAESLALKQEVFSGLVTAQWSASDTAFVHGDFHNENLLFDAAQRVTCVMDYEESFVGSGALDVVNFIQFACCNDGFGNDQVQRSRTFISAYAACSPLSAQQVQMGWNFFFRRVAGSVFMEERLADGNAFFATLILRDMQKMRAHLQYGADIVRALLP